MTSSKLLSKFIRSSSLKMVFNAKASHIGSALSISDIVAVLYEKILILNKKNLKSDLRDRFILSKGHACVAIYSALAAKGFFSKKNLEEYGKDNSLMMSHISHKVDGVEFSTGSLGHGLSFGSGKALALKKLNKKFRVFVLMSDGEIQEGSNWEAMMFSAHHNLDNLIGIIDYNKLQSLKSIKETNNIEPLLDKIQSFGWEVREVDGHNHKDIYKILSLLPWKKGKPSLLIAHTTKGKGVSFMENSVKWHYKSPSEDELLRALKEIENA